MSTALMVLSGFSRRRSRRGWPDSNARIRSRLISTNGDRCPMTPASCIVRDGDRHRETFSAPAAYLRRETRGLAAGSPWPCDLGPDLSRGFRALKTWFTLKTYGTEKLGAMISRTCALAGLSGSPDSGRAAAGIAGAGAAQYRLLSLSHRRRQSGQWRDCHRHPGIGDCGAIDHAARRPARDTRRYRQSSHRYMRHRRIDIGSTGVWGAAIVF